MKPSSISARSGHWLRFLALSVLVCGALCRLQAEPANPPRKTVLVLYSIPLDAPGLHELTTAITDGILKGTTTPIDIYSEYTGLDRFSGPTYEKSLLTLYKERYTRRKADVIVTVGPTALDFVMNTRFLPGVPVVTCYVAKRFVEKARLTRPDLTGAIPAQSAPKTIEMMLAMYPKTRRIHVVLGASEYERTQSQNARILFSPFDGRVQLFYLNDLSLAQMVEKVRNLTDEDLVLFGSLLQDNAGQDFSTNIALTQLVAASRRPVFGAVAEDLGDGILGGVLVSMQLSGRVSAELTLRILNGESAASIAPVADAGSVPMFDVRQMERWGIKEADLPPHSLVKFQKPGLWDLYWKQVSIAIGIILVESLLVAGLVLLLHHKRRYERELTLARTRYRTVADYTLAWEFWRRADGGFEYVSPSCELVSGYPPEAYLENPDLFESIVVEAHRPRWRAYQEAALAGKQLPQLEFQIRTRSGDIRWVEQGTNPVSIGGGVLGGSRGSLRDISDRKQGELALQTAYEKIKALSDQLEAENTYYREKIQAIEPSSEILGQSDAMKYLHYRIQQVAASETTVLIQGETGTGKELAAEAIHKLGGRAALPLIKVNCAALPQGLAESELFGHEKGAFTGAQSQRKGRFELADGATLFLDEVGELSPDIQAKLLRVLQDGEFQRVGGDRTIKVDVRIIAATNRLLAKEVAAGRFREDLWYRLNVFPLTLPALRERPEDIPVLAHAFLIRFCQRLGRPVLDLPQSVLQSMQAYPWPGNVRELQNVIERAVLVSETTSLRLADTLEVAERPQDGAPLKTLVDLEREHIVKVLQTTQGRVEGRGGAAEILDMNPGTLRSRMRKLGIERPQG